MWRELPCQSRLTTRAIDACGFGEPDRSTILHAILVLLLNVSCPTDDNLLLSFLLVSFVRGKGSVAQLSRFLPSDPPTPTATQRNETMAVIRRHPGPRGVISQTPVCVSTGTIYRSVRARRALSAFKLILRMGCSSTCRI